MVNYTNQSGVRDRKNSPENLGSRRRYSIGAYLKTGNLEKVEKRSHVSNINWQSG
ncbi:hypothetical protein KY290_019311 [Solanum tuberosum]|uniref:Uncharacterized protein n=1 Tax=Solanum tuberosum TaxID=4113 RepID=A0ABQ7VIT1_SOLTU|nr:hypothetical protein KY284_018261 [Solanum tuberosum]KAH0763238.1 hypothetical protein KY290_019311 [Solanum tuberosum]